VQTFVARGTADGRICLEDRSKTGTVIRWTFSELTTHSFTWRNEAEDDGGGARLIQMFSARRAR
jgi:hypothetical protein